MKMNTTINWKNDSLTVIRAKQELEKFLEERKEIEGKGYSKVEAYHEKMISRLNQIIAGK